MIRLALVVLAIAPLAIGAQERSVALKDTPRAVILNVTSRFPDATVAGVVRESENGTDVYEVTLKRKGRNIDVTTTLAGQLALIEREITAADLPAPVRKLLRDKYPGSSHRIVEEVTAVSGSTETLSFFEVLLVDRAKQWLEVQVAPDGSAVLKVEKKKAGEPD